MIKLIQSFFYFFRYLFFINNVDVLFYAPQHFNRSNNNNLFFEPLIQACKKNNIKYIFFEEPVFSSSSCRNNFAIPFDFIFYIILILRRLSLTDRLIGKILRHTFLKNLKFKNYIVLSQSLLEFFKGVNPEAVFFDLQHGIIHSNKPNYILNGRPTKNLIEYDIQLLLTGKGYKELLTKSDLSGYFRNKSHVVGSSLVYENVFLHNKPNNCILVTLQFTDDHSKNQNINLLNELEIVIDSNPHYIFYLRNHPRYNNEVDSSILENKENTRWSPSNFKDCLKLCSIHLTAYSTSVFECASYGIPTLFLVSLKNDFNMFSTDFSYPLENNLDSIKENYLDNRFILKDWFSEFYVNFDERMFISLLK